VTGIVVKPFGPFARIFLPNFSVSSIDYRKGKKELLFLFWRTPIFILDFQKVEFELCLFVFV